MWSSPRPARWPDLCRPPFRLWNFISADTPAGAISPLAKKTCGLYWVKSARFNAVERDAYLRDLSLRTSIADTVLREEMDSLAPAQIEFGRECGRHGAGSSAPQKRPRKELVAEQLIGLLISDPSLKSSVMAHASILRPTTGCSSNA